MLLYSLSAALRLADSSHVALQVIGFFSHRLEQAGSDLSVERVQEVIMKGAQALPTDRLKVHPSKPAHT